MTQKSSSFSTLPFLALGFSSGLPLALVFGTLSLWLADVGVSKSAIGLFALVRNPYSFKFVWSPLMDRLRLPVLTARFGQRRGWALLSQFLMMLSIVALGFSDPVGAPLATAGLAILVAFFSASQDIVIDALRIEMHHTRYGTAKSDMGASPLIFGYRIGMLVSGAGAVWMSEYLDWSWVYGLMAALSVVGMATVLWLREPAHHHEKHAIDRAEQKKFLALKKRYPVALARLLAWMTVAVYHPFAQFLQRPHAVMILVFITIYKLSDAYIGMMAAPFYLEIGFSKAEIAAITKVFGFGTTLIGIALGGYVIRAWGLYRSLFVCGALQIVSNALFASLAAYGKSTAGLALVIGVEHVAAGMGSIAFVAYLSGLCHVAFSATQYALLSSLMAFARDLLTATSGLVAERLDWVEFFLFSGALGIPALLLLDHMKKKGLFKEG